MPTSLGEMLDIPGEYQAWLRHSSVAFAVVYAADRLGLLAHLDDGPLTVAEIAARSGHPAAELGRLLAFLGAQGVLDIGEDGRVAATARSRAMCSSAEVRITRMTIETGIAYPDTIGSGVTAYEAHFGLPVFAHLQANPEIGEMFGRVMSETTADAERFIFANHTFEPFALAVDVGGSQGSLLLRLLQAHPDARGVLFDLPATVLHAAPVIAASAAAERVEIVGGDFFAAVPDGGDLYLVKQILHDWSDQECLAILGNVRAAMGAGARLAVVERLIPERNQPHIAYVYDILMLQWTTGRERKLSEYCAMFEASGFAFERVTEDPDGMSVIEAVAV